MILWLWQLPNKDVIGGVISRLISQSPIGLSEVIKQEKCLRRTLYSVAIEQWGWKCDQQLTFKSLPANHYHHIVLHEDVLSLCVHILNLYVLYMICFAMISCHYHHYSLLVIKTISKIYLFVFIVLHPTIASLPTSYFFALNYIQRFLCFPPFSHHSPSVATFNPTQRLHFASCSV